MAQFPRSDCSGSSSWTVDPTGHWFPVGQVIVTPGCVVANQFTFNGFSLTVSQTSGLPKTWVHALKQKYANDVLIDPHNPDAFGLPLVRPDSLPISLDADSDS